MLDGYTLTAHDRREFTDDEIADGVAFSNLLQSEVMPDDPPTPVDLALAAHRATPERIRRFSFRVRDAEGALVGSAGTGFDPEHDDNPDVMQFGLHVHPDHRRNGVGLALMAHLVALAEREQRTRLITDTNDRVPGGEAFARAVGAEPKLTAHVNHLPIDAVDRAEMERWVAEADTRAADYELITFDGAVPDDLLESFTDLVLVMNSAPLDDLDINDFTLTPEQLREMEQQFAATGGERWTAVVRHRETGELAGFHDLTWNPAKPALMWVNSTGVQPEHRGHALGKWLKAALLLRVLDERPEVTEIRTGNADSNDAMLGINTAMGYRPLVADTAWSVPTETVAKVLAERGVQATVALP